MKDCQSRIKEGGDQQTVLCCFFNTDIQGHGEGVIPLFNKGEDGGKTWYFIDTTMIYRALHGPFKAGIDIFLRSFFIMQLTMTFVINLISSSLSPTVFK